MKQVVVIHSAGPQGRKQGSTGLISYLTKELAGEAKVLAPLMPTPENPNYQQWRQVIKHHIANLPGDVLLVGHSMGGSVLMKYLSEEPIGKSIKGLFLIASPYWGLNDKWERPDIHLRPQFERDLPPLPNVFLYHSRGEAIVPFSHHMAYAYKLSQARIRVLEGDDHLFSMGLPNLVEDIRSI